MHLNSLKYRNKFYSLYRFKKIGICLSFCFLLSNCSLVPSTKIEILDGKWAVNGELTNKDSKAEGLLMNARMVNATFEDLVNPDFNPRENALKFKEQIHIYKEAGLNAFTLNLQGGMPGYEGAINSAFTPNGKLKNKYLHRLSDIIRICDVQGMIVILGCFYQRQDQILRDNTAVFQAVKNTVTWLKQQQFKNVLFEIANEYPHKGYDHEVIRNEDTLIEMIDLARSIYPELLISVSGFGNGSVSPKIAEECDFLLIHLNQTPIQKYKSVFEQLMYFHKPIVCNEDDKIGEAGVSALEASVNNNCSWGYMNKELNQHVPIEFLGVEDDTLVYAKIKEITSPIKK